MRCERNKTKIQASVIIPLNWQEEETKKGIPGEAASRWWQRKKEKKQEEPWHELFFRTRSEGRSGGRSEGRKEPEEETFFHWFSSHEWRPLLLVNFFLLFLKLPLFLDTHEAHDAMKQREKKRINQGWGIKSKSKKSQEEEDIMVSKGRRKKSRIWVWAMGNFFFGYRQDFSWYFNGEYPDFWLRLLVLPSLFFCPPKVSWEEKLPQ